MQESRSEETEMSQRIQGVLVNALVAIGVIALLHVFFVAVPSRLVERTTSPAVASPSEPAPPGAGASPVAEAAAEPVHGPSGMAPGILAAPDRN
jgi:hypothetical protein